MTAGGDSVSAPRCDLLSRDKLLFPRPIAMSMTPLIGYESGIFRRAANFNTNGVWASNSAPSGTRMIDLWRCWERRSQLGWASGNARSLSRSPVPQRAPTPGSSPQHTHPKARRLFRNYCCKLDKRSKVTVGATMWPCDGISTLRGRLHRCAGNCPSSLTTGGQHGSRHGCLRRARAKHAMKHRRALRFPPLRSAC